MPGPVLTTSNEAGSRFNGLRSLKDSGWAKAKGSNEESGPEECRGSFQPLFEGRAQVGGVISSVMSGPSILRCLDSELTNF